MPDEADLRRDLDVERAEPVLPAEHVERAAEPRERAGDRHREEVVPRNVDPPVARRLGVEADRAHLVAERRPVEDDPVDDERCERDEEADVQPLQDRIAPADAAASRSSTTSFETGTNGSRSFWSGPPSPNRNAPIQTAIQLSMIVVITSCAPTVAFRKPAIPAQSAPASAPATIASEDVQEAGQAGQVEPTQTAMIAPTRYWPWPPMLNIPQRNANATASPVRMSGTK